MKKRTILECDIPEPTKKITQKEIVYNHLLMNDKKSFTQIVEELHMKSAGHANLILKQLIYEKRVKKETCKCCGITDQYYIV